MKFADLNRQEVGDLWRWRTKMADPRWLGSKAKQKKKNKN